MGLFQLGVCVLTSSALVSTSDSGRRFIFVLKVCAAYFSAPDLLILDIGGHLVVMLYFCDVITDKIAPSK